MINIDLDIPNMPTEDPPDHLLDSPRSIRSSSSHSFLPSSVSDQSSDDDDDIVDDDADIDEDEDEDAKAEYVDNKTQRFTHIKDALNTSNVFKHKQFGQNEESSSDTSSDSDDSDIADNPFFNNGPMFNGPMEPIHSNFREQNRQNNRAKMRIKNNKAKIRRKHALKTHSNKKQKALLRKIQRGRAKKNKRRNKKKKESAPQITKPSKPKPPTFTSITRDSVTVHWKAPDSDGFSLIDRWNASLMVGEVSGEWKQIYDDVVDKGNKYSVQSLLNGTLYHFRVRCSNSVGWSKWSNRAQVRTKGATDTSVAEQMKHKQSIKDNQQLQKIANDKKKTDRKRKKKQKKKQKQQRKDRQLAEMHQKQEETLKRMAKEQEELDHEYARRLQYDDVLQCNDDTWCMEDDIGKQQEIMDRIKKEGKPKNKWDMKGTASQKKRKHKRKKKGRKSKSESYSPRREVFTVTKGAELEDVRREVEEYEAKQPSYAPKRAQKEFRLTPGIKPDLEAVRRDNEEHARRMMNDIPQQPSYGPRRNYSNSNEPPAHYSNKRAPPQQNYNYPNHHNASHPPLNNGNSQHNNNASYPPPHYQPNNNASQPPHYNAPHPPAPNNNGNSVSFSMDMNDPQQLSKLTQMIQATEDPQKLKQYQEVLSVLTIQKLLNAKLAKHNPSPNMNNNNNNNNASTPPPQLNAHNANNDQNNARLDQNEDAISNHSWGPPTEPPQPQPKKDSIPHYRSKERGGPPGYNRGGSSAFNGGRGSYNAYANAGRGSYSGGRGTGVSGAFRGGGGSAYRGGSSYRGGRGGSFRGGYRNYNQMNNVKEVEWRCPNGQCGSMNWPSRSRCRDCGASNPNPQGGNGYGRGRGGYQGGRGGYGHQGGQGGYGHQGGQDVRQSHNNGGGYGAYGNNARPYEQKPQSNYERKYNPVFNQAKPQNAPVQPNEPIQKRVKRQPPPKQPPHAPVAPNRYVRQTGGAPRNRYVNTPNVEQNNENVDQNKNYKNDAPYAQQQQQQQEYTYSDSSSDEASYPTDHNPQDQMNNNKKRNGSNVAVNHNYVYDDSGSDSVSDDPMEDRGGFKETPMGPEPVRIESLSDTNSSSTEIPSDHH